MTVKLSFPFFSTGKMGCFFPSASNQNTHLRWQPMRRMMRRMSLVEVLIYWSQACFLMIIKIYLRSQLLISIFSILSFKHIMVIPLWERQVMRSQVSHASKILLCDYTCCIGIYNLAISLHVSCASWRNHRNHTDPKSMEKASQRENHPTCPYKPLSR